MTSRTCESEPLRFEYLNEHSSSLEAAIAHCVLLVIVVVVVLVHVLVCATAATRTESALALRVLALRPSALLPRLPIFLLHARCAPLQPSPVPCASSHSPVTPLAYTSPSATSLRRQLTSPCCPSPHLLSSCRHDKPNPQP